MRSPVTLQFLEEVRRFDLRFACDDCAHFEPERCLHGYPLGERRARVLSVGDHVEFCKEFEGAR